MLRSVGAGLLAVALCGSAQEPQPPKLAEHTAVRPVAKLADGKDLRAGTAVLARLAPGQPLILFTALHLFGPPGGLPHALPPERLDEFVKKVTAESMDEKSVVATFAGSKIPTGYPMSAVMDCSGDVAAFALEGECKAAGVVLADADPKVGDAVWVVGDEADSKAPSQKTWRLTVTEVTPLGVVLTPKKKINIRAFSGAPILNAKGVLVGLLVGAEETAAGPKTKIFAIGAGSIRKRLSESKK